MSKQLSLNAQGREPATRRVSSSIKGPPERSVSLLEKQFENPGHIHLRVPHQNKWKYTYFIFVII